MRPTRLAAMTIAFVGLTAVASSLTSAAPTLVELFTSEGCNSCPPADTYVHELTTRTTPKSDENIFITCHVDYWDYLGWKDPYGLAFATKRQRDYATAMKQRRFKRAGVYTPQIIVAGRTAFVGSDRKTGNATLDSSRRGTAAPLEVKLLQDGHLITASVDLPALPEGVSVIGVLVEDGLSSVVTAGENEGRTLKHDRVARAVGTGVVEEGKARIPISSPNDVVQKNASIVVFVQAKLMGDILAVGTTKLESEPAPENEPATAPGDSDKPASGETDSGPGTA